MRTFGTRLLMMVILALPATSWACGAFPAGVASSDRVLAFLPVSSKVYDGPLSGAGSSSEGMVVYNSTDGTIRYCDGTSWKTVSKGTTPAYAALWGLNTNRQLGTSETNADQASPVRLSSTNFSTTAWKTLGMSMSSHTCAIRSSDDRMFCWGNATNGKLGNGTTRGYATPVSLNSVGGWDTTAWKDLSAGPNHTCGIRLSDSRLFCWGAGTNGQLGNAGNTDISTPTALTSTGSWDTTTWKSVAVGDSHTCAIRSTDDRLFCWGLGTSGQLGTGATADASSPTALASAGGWDTTAWKAVGAGYLHTCAIRLSDDRIFCWGEGLMGRLGNGGTTASTSPTALSATGGWDTTAWKSLTVGRNHSCGIRNSDSRLFCWGEGGSGRLGNGLTTNATAPVSLTATGSWDVVAWKTAAAGSAHTCAIRTSDNLMYCWGSGTEGQLGNGGTASVSTPTALNSTGAWNSVTWDSVAMGSNHTCALRLSDKYMYCWGQGVNGRLGTGNISDQSSPVALASNSGWSTATWKMIAGGSSHFCGIKESDDRLYCWGNSGSGQSGTGSTVDQPSPMFLDSSTGWDSSTWKTVAAGSSHTCAIRLTDDKLYCWGNGTSGRLGTGSTTTYNYPVALNSTGSWDAMTWKSVTTGQSHTCAIRLTDDFLFCWGAGANGRLGNGLTTNQQTPVSLNSTGGWNAMTWKSVSAGQTHTCAIRLTDNKLFCWGGGTSGQLGNGGATDQTSPVALDSAGSWDLATWKTVTTGLSHTCAIRLTDDKLFCWGAGGNGRLGSGDTSDRSVPTPLSSTGGWDAMTWKTVSAGDSHTCAIRATDDQLFCWGTGTNGRLGNAATTDQWTPVALDSTGSWSTYAWQSVAAGGSSTVAIESTANYTLSSSSPSGVGTNDFVLRFRAFSSQLHAGKFSWMGAFNSTIWASGVLVYDTINNKLVNSDGSRWIPLLSSATATDCTSAYPDNSTSRVIEFIADGSSKTYSTMKSSRTTPRTGSFVYNSTLKVLQFCNGSKWQTLTAP